MRFFRDFFTENLPVFLGSLERALAMGPQKNSYNFVRGVMV